MSHASETSTTELRPRNTASEQEDWDAATALTADDIVQQSRIADATVPEGGYGWVVVGACSLLAFWFVGTSYSWGVLQDALVKRGLSSPSTLAFVGSLAVACIAILAIVNASLTRALGARRVSMAGISLVALGEILSGFSVDNVGGLFVTTGVIMGVGCSLCFMTVSVTPAQYFSKRRGLAYGLVYAGGGAGGTVISVSMNALIAKLGPAWTFRAVGLMTLATGLPTAWFVKERVPIRTASFIEWRLFRDARFVLLFLAAAIATFPLLVPPFFLPLYSTSLGLSPRVGAGLLAGFNFSSAVGRILCGFGGDRLGPVNALFFSLLLSAISTLALWPISSTLAPLVAFAVINGAANGGFFAIMPTVVGNVFGSARVSVAMGMIVTGWTGGYLMGAPIAGYILEAYGGETHGFKAYRPAIFYAGSLALGASGLVAFVRLRISTKVTARV